jgi:hypothetical protein
VEHTRFVSVVEHTRFVSVVEQNDFNYQTIKAGLCISREKSSTARTAIENLRAARFACWSATRFVESQELKSVDTVRRSRSLAVLVFRVESA